MRYFVLPHSRGYFRQVDRRERLQNRRCISGFVHFDDVRDVSAATTQPDDPARENQAEKQEAARVIGRSGGKMAGSFYGCQPKRFHSFFHPCCVV